VFPPDSDQVRSIDDSRKGMKKSWK